VGKGDVQVEEESSG
jgi:uncharacterized protein (TIGR00269 family)